jgi:membrane fusion protein, multidrug efflux system
METSSQPVRRRTGWPLLGVLLVGAVALAAWDMRGGAAPAAVAPPPKVPVEVANAERRDVPVYLQGIGTVQAFNTVTVHSRVDGELMKVAFTEGQDVKVGDLLAQIDPRPFKAQLEQAEAKKAQDEAQLADAKINLARFATLALKEFATQQSVDTQRAMVAQLTATVQADQAAIDFARTQLQYTTINSPIDGRTGIRQVDQGNIIHATDTTGLVVLTQLKPISMIFSLPEDALPDVSRAMQAGTVEVIALSRDEKEQLGAGTLALIDNEIDQTTGTMRLKATFPNRDHRLWPGQFVNARLLVTTRRNVVTVPSIAVQRGAQGPFVYVVKRDNTVELRWLTMGEIRDKVAVIERGVADGERVVTVGQYRLQPGTPVAVETKQIAGK